MKEELDTAVNLLLIDKLNDFMKSPASTFFSFEKTEHCRNTINKIRITQHVKLVLSPRRDLWLERANDRRDW